MQRRRKMYMVSYDGEAMEFDDFMSAFNYAQCMSSEYKCEIYEYKNSDWVLVDTLE